MFLDILSANRFLIFLSILFILMLAEKALPDSLRKYERQKRWGSNFGIGLLNSIILYFLLPASVVGIAAFVEQQQWGLLNLWNIHDNITIKALLIIGCVIFLDYTIYLQHVLFHKIPWLWPFHAMHHSDEELDVSSGVRFHPIEALISILYKTIIIAALGLPVIAVMIFEIMLSSFALITHANVKLPQKLNKYLEYIFVTPKMHLMHHSTKISEQNSNYGFCLSIWDHISQTYKRNDETSLKIGLSKFQKGEYISFKNMLKQPFQIFSSYKKRK